MKKYKILDWIDINKLDMFIISSHIKAIYFLEKNPDKINWDTFSLNPAGISILQKNIDKINWDNLSFNTSAISILQENKDKINWDNLSFNIAAMSILKENKDKINWNNLFYNNSIEAYQLIKENKDKIKNWENLCYKQYDWINDIFNDESVITKLSYNELCALSSNPVAIPVIKKYNIWTKTSENYNAIELLKANPDKIQIIDLIKNYNSEAVTLYEEHRHQLTAELEEYYLREISKMDNFVPFLKKNKQFINQYICENKNPEAIPLIKEYVEKETANNKPFHFWSELSQNPIAVNILEKYPDFIDWHEFCHLEEAIPVIEKHLYKVDWFVLSSNKKAMHILKATKEKIDWRQISYNDIYEEIVE